MSSIRTITGITFVDLERLWEAARGIPVKDRARALMGEAGVRFFDKENTLIAQPVAAIVGVGGIPVTWPTDSSTETISLINAPNVPIRIDELRDMITVMMGYAGFFTYLNPKDATAQEMNKKMQGQGHFSTAHTVMLNIAVFGVSTAVENEFNSQRDILHFSRLTEARTHAQDDPSLVVLFPEMVSLYSEIRKNTVALVENIGPGTSMDAVESRNLIFPSAKATLFLISGTIRNFQKLVSALSDSGKEEEYKRVLALINDQLAVLCPNFFYYSSDRGISYPEHFVLP